MKSKLLIIGLFFLIPIHIFGADIFEGKTIGKISIEVPPDFDVSNIEKDFLIFKGKPFSSRKIDQTIKKLYLSKLFHNIFIHVESFHGQQVHLIVSIELAKQVESIIFEGNHIFSDIVLLRIINLRRGTLFNDTILLEDKKLIHELYKEEGYHNVEIEIHLSATNQSNLLNITYEIQENKPATIREFILDSVGRPKSKYLSGLLNTKKDNIFKNKE